MHESRSPSSAGASSFRRANDARVTQEIRYRRPHSSNPEARPAPAIEVVAASGSANDALRIRREQQQQQQLALVSTAAATFGACLSAGAIAVLLYSEAARGVPVAIAVCLAFLASLLCRIAFATLLPAGHRAHNRLRPLHRHITGEHAAYVRTSQRLAMLDRDFTAADYDMLLDLDNNSQRLRQFLEGASQETIDRLPTYSYKVPSAQRHSAKRKTAVIEEHDSRTETDTKTEDINLSSGNAVDSSTSNSESYEDQKRRCAIRDEVVGDLDGISREMPLDKSIDETLRPQTAFTCETGETATKCTICLEPFEEGMRIRILPCFHQFMAGCIDPWLLQQAKCPVCKGDAIAGPIDLSGM